jgi:hypothetical protein
MSFANPPPKLKTRQNGAFKQASIFHYARLADFPNPFNEKGFQT